MDLFSDIIAQIRDYIQPCNLGYQKIEQNEEVPEIKEEEKHEKIKYYVPHKGRCTSGK